MSDIELAPRVTESTRQAASSVSSRGTTNSMTTDQFAGNSSLAFCSALFLTASLFSLFFLMTNLDLVSAANHLRIGVMF
jgi:hypothetical protein